MFSKKLKGAHVATSALGRRRLACVSAVEVSASYVAWLDGMEAAGGAKVQLQATSEEANRLQWCLCVWWLHVSQHVFSAHQDKERCMQVARHMGPWPRASTHGAGTQGKEHASATRVSTQTGTTCRPLIRNRCEDRHPPPPPRPPLDRPPGLRGPTLAGVPRRPSAS